MALNYSTQSVLGSLAHDFKLIGVDDKFYTLADFKDSKALLIIFMCNHCPYVIAVQGRINAIAAKFKAQGLAVIGINSNDFLKYPADSMDAMKTRAREQQFIFPYVLDETQDVARAYDAVCTPDPYLFRQSEHHDQNAVPKWELVYRGRIDDSWKDERKVTEHSLVLAIEAVLGNRQVTQDQTPSMGCSIKWRS